MLKSQNAIIRAEYSYLLADIEVRQYEGREKHVGCTFFWGGANIYLSKIPAIKECNSYYSSRKVACLTAIFIQKRTCHAHKNTLFMLFPIYAHKSKVGNLHC